MSKARCILPDTYHLISRRCTQNQRLLSSSIIVNIIFWFCLGATAISCNIGVVGVVMMANGYCALVHDRDGNLSEFLHRFHRLVAVVMNCYLLRRENFWASGDTNVIECGDSNDQLRKLAMLHMIPVTEHLVEHAKDWPGVNSLVAQLRGEELEFTRPNYYFTKHGRLPARVKIRFVRPDGFAHKTQKEWAAILSGAIEAAESEVAAEREMLERKASARKAFVRLVFAVPPKERAQQKPTWYDKLKPLSKWLCADVFARQRLFLKRYAEAFALLKKGFRDVLFPAGTYRLRVLKLVKCEPFPNSS